MRCVCICLIITKGIEKIPFRFYGIMEKLFTPRDLLVGVTPDSFRV